MKQAHSFSSFISGLAGKEILQESSDTNSGGFQLTESEATILNEAKFDAKKLAKVVKLYSRILGKSFGGEFKNLGVEDFKRKGGIGKGIRTMNSKGIQIRYNWDAAMSKATKFTLTSMDYWEADNLNFSHPTRTVKFGPELNVVMVLNTIYHALKSGTIKESQEIIAEAKRTPAEKADWLESKGLARSFAKSEKVMRGKAGDAGYGEELEVFLGSKETNSFEGNIKAVETQYNQEVYADPDTVFDDIEELTSLIANGQWRTLIVCGMGGVGKCLQADTEVEVEFE